MFNMLVLYYSWSNGNTKAIAEKLAAAKGADLARIDTVVPYPDDYNTAVSQGQREVNSGYRPELKPLDKNPADYDVIAVGTPTWWYTMAPAVAAFFETHDLSGKTVIPFMTNGGWPGHVIDDMTDAATGADVVHPMAIQFDSTGGSDLVTPASDIDQWIESI